MTIKTRLITMMAVAIVGFAAVFLTATIGLSQLSAHITEIGEQSIPHLETAEDIIAESLAFQRDMLRLVLVTDPARRERIQNRIIATRAHIAQLNEKLNSSLTNENAKQLLSEIMRLKQTPVNFNNQIMELIAKNQLEQAIEIATGLPYRDSYEAYMTKMKELIAFEKKSAQEEVIAGEADAMRAKLWILAISSIALIGLILFSLFVIRSVTQAVNQVVSAISNVAQTATFTTRIPARHDELNAISTHLNTLFDGLDKAIQEANRVVSAIAQADFTARVQGQYMGDLDKLKQGVNASAESVSFMMNELEKVMKGLNDGKFNTRMDNRVPQVFRNLVEQALSNIHTVIGDINTVMAQMNQGNFTARVQAQTSGDLQAMKLNINDAMTRLAEAVAGITHIVTAQSQGDLTQALQLEMKGQLQQLKNAINDSSRQLKNIVGSAVHAAMVVDDASTQVSSGASNLASRVQQQAAAIEQTSATMTEMTSAVQANTTNARKVADLTGQVQTQAGEGVSVMQETISAMQSIQESSNKIADIVTLIDGIAFQTNLLALNAAVEAARAGEHGRGFAVVAGEVRALAQKSADAAKDIKDLIGDSAHRVERGTHLAQKSGQVLNEIANSIQQVAGMVSAIANASHEQSIGIEQVHRSVADIDRVTQENAALVEETSAASESLEREANNLRQNMAFFRT